MTKPDANPSTPEPRGDDPRAVILSRRARFVGLALASAGVVVGCEPVSPHPCLSPPALPPTATVATGASEDGGTGVAPDGPDGDVAEADAGGGGHDATPRPCLTPRRPPDEPPGPSACLSIERPSPPPKGRTPMDAGSRVCLTLAPID